MSVGAQKQRSRGRGAPKTGAPARSAKAPANAAKAPASPVKAPARVAKAPARAAEAAEAAETAGAAGAPARAGGANEVALRYFVEEMGLQFEMTGQPRMAGRILGHLLVCEPPYQTAEELARTVGASRASVSTMTRLLIQTSLVERVAQPGDRRDRFGLRAGSFVTLMLERVRLVTQFCNVLERGLAALEGAGPARRKRLEEMLRFYAYLGREMPRIIEQYEREARGGAKAPG